MLKQSRSFSSKRISQLVLVAALSVLTACGGGGGGGGGKKTLPTTVRVDFPAANTTITDGAADFQVSLVTGTTDGLVIALNGTDVTALFTGSPRTASSYALSGLLVDGINNFNAQTSGSKVSGVQFTYNAKPEAILTALSDCSSGVCTVNGETHKAKVASLKLNDAVPGFFDIANEVGVQGSTFSIAGVDIPAVGLTPKTAADYSLELTDTNGDKETSSYVQPKSIVKYGAAMQLNNSALNVIKPWIADVVKKQVQASFDSVVVKDLWKSGGTPIVIDENGDLVEANFDVTLKNKAVINDGGDLSACVFLKTARLGLLNDCYLFISQLDDAGATVTADVKVVDNADPNSIGLDLTINYSKLNMTLDSVGYYNNIYNVGHRIKASYAATMVFKLKLYRDADNILAFDWASESPLTATFSAPALASVLCSSCDKDPDYVGLLTTAADILSQEVTNTAGNVTSGTIDPASALGQLRSLLLSNSVANRSVYQFIKNSSNEVKSALYFDFSGSVVTEAKTTLSNANCDAGTKVCGAFFGLGGSTYASKDCPNDPAVTECFPGTANALPETLNTALGSYFDPLDANGAVNKNFFNATDDITLALSENSLNQLMLSIYQSKWIQYQGQTFTVAELGDLGSQIINLTAGSPLFVTANDLVTMSFDLQAVPFARFDAAGLEFGLNKMAVTITLYRACSGVTINTCTALYTSDFSLDARMLATFGLNGLLPNMPEVSIDDVAVTVVGGVTNTFLTPLAPNPANNIINDYVRTSVNSAINAGTLSVIMPAFIQSLVNDQVASINQPITPTVDLKGLGLNNKSLEVRLVTLAVDSTKEFVQLAATLHDVPFADSVKGFLRLNITDSCLNGDDSKKMPEPVGCPGYVAPTP